MNNKYENWLRFSAGLKSFYSRVEANLAYVSWVMVNRLASMAIKLLVAVALARYLGPEQYGLLSYVLSLVALFSVLGHMGVTGTAIRGLVAEPYAAGEMLGSVVILRSLGVAIGFPLLVLYAAAYEGVGSEVFWILIVTGLAILQAPFRTLDLWFEANLKVKFVTISSLVGLILASLVKILFIFLGEGVFYIAASGLLQVFVTIFLLASFFLSHSPLGFGDLKFNLSKAIELFKKSWPIYAGAILAILYLKIDLVMLGWIAGMEEVGQYAVASQLSEAWYFLPAAIVSSVFPALMRLKDGDQRLFDARFQQLLDVLFIISISVAVFMSLFAHVIVHLLFGSRYEESVSVLIIHTWSGVFIFLRAAFSKWILVNDVLIFSLITNGIGAFVNIGLNIPLIAIYGAKGAAISTLISYAMASFLSLYFYSVTRPVFFMMLKSIISPFIYILNAVNDKGRSVHKR